MKYLIQILETIIELIAHELKYHKNRNVYYCGDCGENFVNKEFVIIKTLC